MEERINVTKTFLPPIEEYEEYLNKIWRNNQLTNQGPLLLELESRIKEYLKIPYFHFVTNGTLALQLSIRALDLDGSEVITTPFSYVASVSSLLWEGCEPVFVDIEPETFCIDATKIEAAITPKTKAILAVHVFGNPCDIEAIERIANKHNLRVIYDAAHAFGVQYSGRSLLSYGDISTCSFHATKLFHTIEGGAVITNSKTISDKVELRKRFGHEGDEHFMLGMNAKASEFQAAMGLCNLRYLSEILDQRKHISDLYTKLLSKRFTSQKIREDTKYNYSYYPILAGDEKELEEIISRLNDKNVFPRRYFYPSLNKIPYIKNKSECPISEDIASRIVCLPLYYGLEEETVHKICEVINS